MSVTVCIICEELKDTDIDDGAFDIRDRYLCSDCITKHGISDGI